MPNKNEIVVKQPQTVNNVDLATGIKIVVGVLLAGGLVLAGLVAGLIWLVDDTFGRDGRVILLTALFILVLLWFATWILGAGERRAERLYQRFAEGHMAMERSDDQGEIARNLVPALINNATKHEGHETQKMIAFLQMAMGALKEAGGGADDAFTQARAVRAERRQITAKGWDVDEDTEDDDTD